MRSLQMKAALVLLTLVVTLGLAGCGGSKEFSEDDFKKVIPGMEEAKVTELLGKPKETVDAPAPMEGIKGYFYESKGKFYNVVMGKDGKVMGSTSFPDKAAYDAAKSKK